jgi:hypothetical protein
LKKTQNDDAMNIQNDLYDRDPTTDLPICIIIDYYMINI